MIGAVYLTKKVRQPDDKEVFLPGETTHGHYQIQLKCSECHDQGSHEVKQDACIKCHQEELEESQDSHPETKFNDITKFHLVENIDARKCISCHTEHNPHMTNKMGVTLPEDFCMECHKDVGEDRPSHKDLSFSTCATAGCHNYHDNRALYEGFLLKHFGEDNNLKQAMDYPIIHEHKEEDIIADAPSVIPPNIHHDWASTSHAKAGVNCKDCHQPDSQPEWTDKVSYKTCQSCHADETKGFLAGKHGMRLAHGLSPMTPGEARLPMRQKNAHKELNCISCHSDHRFDRREASVNACIKCHDDEHSNNYLSSPHYKTWQSESLKGVHMKGVSCATCHMPRVMNERKEIKVEHNQNATLRPNEKMIRSACMKCHGLQFSLNALADEELIRKNFKGQPNVHIKSIDMAKEREKK